MLPPDDLDEIVRGVGPHWEKLRGQRIFITGGTGFFGRWLLESFARANAALDLRAEVVVLSRDPEKFCANAPHLAGNPALHFVSGDVRTFTHEAVRAQLGESGRFHFVLHAAMDAAAHRDTAHALAIAETIADGTRATLHFAQAAGARRLLFVSSGAVYGPQPETVSHLPEDHPSALDPAGAEAAYGEAKRYAEMLCAGFGRHHGIATMVARAFAFVGPYLPLGKNFAIGNFLADALAGGPLRVAGDGTPLRSYLYGTDLAVGLWTLLIAGADGRAYNLGSEEAVSIRELAARVARCFALEASAVKVAQPPDPSRPVARYIPSTARLRQELGWSPHVGLDEALRRTKCWLSSEAGHSVRAVELSS